MEFPPIKLPEELTKILQNYSLNDNSSNNKIELLIKKSQPLTLLIEKTFHSVSPYGSIEQYLSILGPKNFRDRLTSLYLQYFQTKAFPSETNLNYVDYILKKEMEYSFFTMEGHSRIFLFFFYLESIKHSHPQLYNDSMLPQISQMAKLKQYLKNSRQKIKEIDYILLFLLNFKYFIGEEKLNTFFSFLSPFRSFEIMWRLLEEPQKKTFMTNIINYSYSINDNSLYQVYS